MLPLIDSCDQIKSNQKYYSPFVRGLGPGALASDICSGFKLSNILYSVP